jgi:proteasome component ECM29
VFSCVYGAGTTLRLKQAGMEFAVWVLKHAQASALEENGSALLRALLHLLEDGAAAGLEPVF